MRLPALLALALAPTIAAAGGAKKGARIIQGTGVTSATPSACGVKILPLAEGNQWTYSAVAAPLPPEEAIKRLSPAQPKTIVITVKSIEAKKGADTVITLEEKVTVDLTKDEKKPILDERTVTTTITCSDKKFEISPDSFLFAGEPGGYLGMKVDSVEHTKGTSLQLTKGAIGDAEWREDLAIHWTRVPTDGSSAKPASGKLELERRFTPQQPEMIISKLGSYSAEKLGLITTGRITVDGAAADAKPSELPANWVTTMWIAEGVGLVQSLNSYAHMYQLTDAKLK
jgi:hypothetical protein